MRGHGGILQPACPSVLHFAECEETDARSEAYGASGGSPRACSLYRVLCLARSADQTVGDLWVCDCGQLGHSVEARRNGPLATFQCINTSSEPWQQARRLRLRIYVPAVRPHVFENGFDAPDDGGTRLFLHDLEPPDPTTYTLILSP